MQLVSVLFPIIFSIIFGITIFYLCNNRSISKNSKIFIPIFIIVSLIANFLTLGIIESMASHDIEIWSGRITEIEHKEEWDEWHPPTTKTETYTKTVNGKTVTKTRTVTVPGYWEHHYAENYVTTSDNGTQLVTSSPDGKEFNDSYPNTTDELNMYYPVGQATASLHTYENKLQFSKSLFKKGDLHEELVESLPDYPNEMKSDFTVTRLIGDIPNFDETNKALNEWNSELNKMVENPETGKKESWKQVNVIFVNVGDLPIEYGYALEEKWEGGNKNDFVVCFSMVNNQIQWVYPFSWTEVEILKLEVRDLLLDQKEIKDFKPIVDEVCKLISEKFDRKEMADYNYIKYEHNGSSYLTSFIICLLLFIIGLFLAFNHE